MITVNSNAAFKLDAKGFIQEVYQYQPVDNTHIKVLTGLKPGDLSEVWETHFKTDYIFTQPNGQMKPQFVNNEWVETATDEELGISLDQLKQKKMAELDAACTAAVFGKFTAQVDGVAYGFSNDAEAQSNFKDAKMAWIDGDLQPTQTVKWTAYDANGNVVRLDLDKAHFDPVNMARMTWQQSNVSKLRDNLELKVNAALSSADLDKITW